MSVRHKLICKSLDEYLKNKELDGSVKARLLEESTREQLVNSLEDGTVFSILEYLRDLQELKENDLWRERQRIMKDLAETGADNNANEARELDKRFLEQIDKVADEQQCTLIASGLTIFHQSKTEEELCFQMTVINFIMTLKDVYEQ